MKYSEAILLGSMVTEQAFGESGIGIRACANRAARIAVGASSITGVSNSGPDITTLFPIAATEGIECPQCGKSSHDISPCTEDLCGLVAHLNDRHRWTRERIADFIATHERLEPDMETKTETATELVAQ
jgi:hypothetical protein